MPQCPIPHRHADGSIHYTHCHGEYDASLDPSARASPHPRPVEGRGRTRLLDASLVVAVAAIWPVTLLSSRLTQARNAPERLAPCLEADRGVAPWFEGEVRRRAGLGNASFERGGFRSMLIDYRSAKAQCASGRVRSALLAYGRLSERMLAASARADPDDGR